MRNQNGRLHIDEARSSEYSLRPSGPAALSLSGGHVHELLAVQGQPRSVAAWLTRSCGDGRTIVWCDSLGTPYPPALAAAGVRPADVYFVRPKRRGDLLWAAVEAMRCPGVGVTVGVIDRLTAVEARRLQLAAERGGGVGLLLRTAGAGPHAARTRWNVRPERGSPFVQRWRVRPVHGCGGQDDQEWVLEVDRETHHVRAADVLADRPREAASALTAG